MAGWRFAVSPPCALLAAAAFAWSITAILAAGPAADSPATYAAALPAAQVADVAAGFALLAAGALACTQPRGRLLGVLALLAAVAWFGPDWEGAQEGPPLLRSLGAVVSPFLLLLACHLVLEAAGGPARSGTVRAAVVAAYASTAALTVGRAIFRDPLLDLYCWRNCRDNTFVLHADPGVASALGDVWLWLAAAIALGLVSFAALRLARSTRVGRRVAAPVLAPAVLVGAAEAAYAVALLRIPLEDPERAGFAAIFLIRALAYTALALGLAWSIVRVPRTRARVARLTRELGAAPRPGTLRDVLAAALGDPDLEVLYPRPDSEQLIDADGRPRKPPAPGRGVARITRRGRPLALVLHDPALVDEPELERALGSAARLAVENEALRAATLAQVNELRASRMRIVEAGDAERRRLERNLHDGAQQRLLALSYDLRLARAGAVQDGDRALVTLLEAAREETAAALEELRELAHGIHPAILTEAGLEPALESLADEARLPVALLAVEPARRPPAVETTTYVAVAEAIEDAERRGASSVSVCVVTQDAHLVITADDDGAPRTSGLVHVADRVGALGGSLEAGQTTLRAEIPCA